MLENIRILVITACTADKKFDKLKLPNQLKPADFRTPGLLRRKSEKLEKFKTRAAEMYTGDGHQHLMSGVKKLRDTFGQDINVDVRIISPGYGLLNEKTHIVPYDYDFSKLSIVQIKQLSTKLKIHSKIECSLSRCNLAFFLLSEPYIIACLPCKLPFSVKKPVAQIFLVAEGAQKRIPPNPYIHAVTVGEELGASNYNRKEVVFEKFCKVACDDRGLKVFEEVKRAHNRLLRWFSIVTGDFDLDKRLWHVSTFATHTRPRSRGSRKRIVTTIGIHRATIQIFNVEYYLTVWYNALSHRENKS